MVAERQYLNGESLFPGGGSTFDNLSGPKNVSLKSLNFDKRDIILITICGIIKIVEFT